MVRQIGKKKEIVNTIQMVTNTLNYAAMNDRIISACSHGLDNEVECLLTRYSH